MLPLALLTLLTASPQVIEPWGFALDESLTVQWVRSDSPASRAQVKQGDVLLRVRAPKSEVKGTLDPSDAQAVKRWLAIVKDDVLVLDFVGKSAPVAIRLVEFQPKTGEELKKLTPTEMALYVSKLQLNMQGPSATVPGIHFGAQRAKVTAWVDPETKRVVAVNAGGATGERVWGMFGATYRCASSRAHTLTVTGEALRTPVYVDLKPDKLQGGAHEVQVPLVALDVVAKCPTTPVVTTLDLTLTCEDGTTVEGREKPELEVKCTKPDAYEPAVFSAWQPWDVERVVEGTKTMPMSPFSTSGPQPERVDVLVLNGNDVVSSLRNAWSPKQARESKRVNVPLPKKAGDYSVVYEATWGDGSTSRSERAKLTLQTKAEAKTSKESWAEGTAKMELVQQRVKDEGIDLCDLKTAIPWLRKQPEVEQIRMGEHGDYSFSARNSMVHLVHCHSK